MTQDWTLSTKKNINLGWYTIHHHRRSQELCVNCFASDLEWDIILINEKTLGVVQLDFSITYLNDNRVKDKRNYQIMQYLLLHIWTIFSSEEVELDCEQRTHKSSLIVKQSQLERVTDENPKENLKW